MAVSKECLFCGATANTDPIWHNDIYAISNDFYTCPTCGRYEAENPQDMKEDRDKFSSYLYHNSKITSLIDDKRYFIYIGSSENFEKVKEKYPYSNLLTKEQVENWYPKTFSEKMDLILLGLAKLSQFDGEKLTITSNHVESLLFIDRKADKLVQISFLLDYLADTGYLTHYRNVDYFITLLPEGLKRIDDLQKNQSNNKNAFVAMAFNDDNHDVRDAIKEAIEKAGYIPRLMDEIFFNKQIVPEMLYEIKHSKFTVADLTDHNNGAYYEAGYASGLGKEVILLCKKDKFSEVGHFDIKQVQSILWEDTDDLIKQLKMKIEKTIV